MAIARAHGETWDLANATHLGLIRRAVDAHGGVCVRTEGDAFFGAFQEAGAAVLAAADAQRALSIHDWPAEIPVMVRMGLHSGEAHLAGDDYGGFDVNRVARIAAAGHGGQVLLSEPTRLLAEGAIGDGIAVRDLGRHVLRDVPTPERLYQLDIKGLRTEFPPLRTTRPSTGNLAPRLTSFIGRDRELEQLDSMLSENRMVTLTGPGGIGKTSLAIELGRAWQDRVPDGVWFVALDSISEPGMVRAEIARSLGLFDGPDRPAADGLERFLAERSTVLVLDNYEHVLEAAADVNTILRASPGLRVVVTSRAPLRIQGEQEFPVHPLAEGSAGPELFLQRARAVRPGLDPNAERTVVDEICSMVDGLPLGLELAAARAAVLPLPAIRDRLAARLPLPGSGPRDAPQRQRTLEAAIAWSHDLLGEDDQQLLHDLAVFEGSFDVEQASQVAEGDVLSGLTTLAEQSLLVPEPASAGSGIRYRVLQTIRSFSLDRLVTEGREADVRRRHAVAFLELVGRASVHLPGADQAGWLDRLAPEQANLRSATRWAIDAGELDLALGLIAHSWRFWQLAGHLAEGRDLAEAALSMPGADAPTATRLEAVVAAAGIAYWRADVETATRYYEEELDLSIRLGDRAGEADAHFNLAFAKNMHIGAAAAWAEAEAAIRLFEDLGDEQGLARTIWSRGTLVMVRDGPAKALPIFQEALAAFERTGDAWFRPMAMGSLTWCYFAMNEPLEAARSAAETVVEYHALNDRTTTTISLAPSARVALDGGMAEEAAVLLGAFDNLCEVYGVRPPAGIMYLIAGGNIEERTRDALDPEEFAAATERGRRLTVDEAVALVVDVCGRVVASGSGDRLQ
jgi:predicted ATPase